jgi:hypothetical protein
VRGSERPPVATTTRAAASTPPWCRTRKAASSPAPPRSTPVTRQPARMSTPSAAQRCNRAERTVAARSLTGNSLPPGSLFSSTPSEANHARVAATSKPARMLRMTLREPVDELKSAAVTVSLVTLQRPPPEMRIFLPILAAPSRTTTRRAPPRSAARMAALRPAAPAPTTATSTSAIAQSRPAWRASRTRTSRFAEPGNMSSGTTRRGR